MKILVTGGSGFLGRNILKTLSSKYSIDSPTSIDLDLTKAHDVNNFFLNKNYEWVIHTAIKGGKRKVKDSKDVFSDNIFMFNNLINNKSNFKNFINFSSGAELDRRYNIDLNNNNIHQSFPIDFYGLSKNIISRILLEFPEFYNFRIFGLFGLNEGEDRFMTNTIKSIKQKRNIEIFEDKFFDFFYIQDLIILVDDLISGKLKKIPKKIDLVYSDKYLLSEIAKIILRKSESNSIIEIKQKKMGKDYTGISPEFINKIGLYGLNEGINDMIDKIK